MNVSVVTTAKTDEEARKLLQLHRHAVHGRSSVTTGARSSEGTKWRRPQRSPRKHKTPKYKVRLRNRCRLCGRPRAYMRKFALCRLCFRKLALEGDVTGVTKSSW